MRAGSLTRAAAAGIVAGAAAGAATGVGARIVMRGIALHAGGRASGLYTSTGARVGDVTLGGSLYVIGVAAGLGALLGAAYTLVRSALPRPRGLAFGLLLLVAGLSLLIDHDRFDFRLFHPRLLNVALFAALFLLFGISVAALADRLAPPGPARGHRLVLTASLVAVSAVGLVRDVRSAHAVVRHEDTFLVSFVAPTHSPVVNKPWHYVVRVTDAQGRPVHALVHLQVLFLGLPVGEVGRHEVNGIWQETIRWPPRARGHRLVLRALVTVDAKTQSAIYGLKAR